MMDLMAQLSQSKGVSAAIFVACVVFTVTGLTALQSWSQRADRNDARLRTVAAMFAVVFAAMLALGLGDMLRDGKTFLNLSLLLCGAAGLGILGELAWGFVHGSAEELRRIDAHEL